jgi:D-glycero-D-manno-heptose 1,7-bisphosphate phosphatase
MIRNRNKAIFFDRDGIINKQLTENRRARSPRNINEFKLNLEIKKYLDFFRRNYFYNIIITNQPEVKRGLVKRKMINLFHSRIKKKLPIDRIYVCYDTSNKSFFRKPNPGMLLKASKDFKINLKKSYFIGDRYKDIYAGNRVKCKTVFIDYNYNEIKPKKYYLYSKNLIKGLKLIKNDIVRNYKISNL